MQSGWGFWGRAWGQVVVVLTSLPVPPGPFPQSSCLALEHIIHRSCYARRGAGRLVVRAARAV